VNSKRFKDRTADISSILKKAESLVKSKNYKRAIDELEKVRFRSVDYYLLLAEAYEGLGRSEEAERCLEEARFLDGEIRSKEKINKAINLAAKKRFLDAERELFESIELNPFDKSAYLTLYSIYKEIGTVKKQIKVLEEIKTLDPFSPFPYIELARIYYFRRNYPKAIEVLKDALSRLESPELHFELGKVLADTGKFEEAKEELSKACLLDFKNVEYRQKLAEVFVQEEDYEGALDVVMSTLELFPDATYVIQSAAALYDLLGKEELAEYYYRLAVSKSEGFVKEDALKVLAEFLAEKGKFDEAEFILKEIITTSDNVWMVLDAFAELAIILFEQDRFLDIAEWGRKVLKNPEILDEEYCEVAEIVADALYEDGKHQEALEFYKEILSYSRDEKLIKRAYSKVKELEEIINLEKLL